MLPHRLEKYWIPFVLVFGVCMFVKPALCFVMLGLLVFYLGLTYAIFLRRLRRVGYESPGTILEYQENSKGSRIPYVEFTTVTGQVIKSRPYLYTTTDLDVFRLGRSPAVTVLYDPDNPLKFVITADRLLNRLALAAIIVAGLLFAVLSICNVLGFISII